MMFRIILAIGCLLVAAPIAAQDRDGWPTHLALGTYVVAGFVDASQTAFCMGAGTCREVNPLFRRLMERRGVVPALAIKGAAHVGISYLLLRQHRQHPRVIFWTAVGLTALQTGVVVHNARRARRVGVGR